MPVKLNHYWTIIQDRTEDYNKFMINKFIPGINKLGLHTVAGWGVLVGAISEIMLENVAEDLNRLEEAMRDKRFKALKGTLLEYVKNYKTKVLVKTGKKDAYSTDVKPDTVKHQAQAIVRGRVDSHGVFQATEVLTRCPSRYESGVSSVVGDS